MVRREYLLWEVEVNVLAIAEQEDRAGQLVNRHEHIPGNGSMFEGNCREAIGYIHRQLISPQVVPFIRGQ